MLYFSFIRSQVAIIIGDESRIFWSAKICAGKKSTMTTSATWKWKFIKSWVQQDKVYKRDGKNEIEPNITIGIHRECSIATIFLINRWMVSTSIWKMDWCEKELLSFFHIVVAVAFRTKLIKHDGLNGMCRWMLTPLRHCDYVKSIVLRYDEVWSKVKFDGNSGFIASKRCGCVHILFLLLSALLYLPQSKRNFLCPHETIYHSVHNVKLFFLLSHTKSIIV